MVDRDLDDLGHLVGLEMEFERARDEGHRRVDTVVAGRDVEGRQPAQDPDRREVRPELLHGLPEGRGLEGFAGMLLAARERDLAAVVEDALRSPGQEHPQSAALLVEEDEDPGLERGILDLEIGLLARPRLRDHAQLGGDAGERGPEALLDPAQDVIGIHGD